MKKLSMTYKKWLIIAHIVFISVFTGTVVVNLLLSFAAANANDIEAQRTAFISLQAISDLKIIYFVAIGSLISGLILSIFTQWGMFKYYWIVFKELIFTALIVLQMLGNRVWIKEADLIIRDDGYDALSLAGSGHHLALGYVAQFAGLALMIGLSVFKPWGKIGGRKTGRK